MLYRVLGPLLEKAAAVLRSDAVAAGGEHADVQRRRVAAFLARVAAMWPGLDEALGRENLVLGTAILEARSALARHHLATGEGTGDAEVGAVRPLTVHRQYLAELDRLVVRLQAAGDEEWAQAARRALRRRLAEAARVQMALVAGAPTD